MLRSKLVTTSGNKISFGTRCQFCIICLLLGQGIHRGPSKAENQQVLPCFCVLTLFRTESEYPYHVQGGGAPEATPCISGTIHQKVTKLLEHTYVGKCQGFKA